MALQSSGDLSMSDVETELGLTAPQDLEALFAAASHLKFDKTYVNKHNPNLTERTASNLTTPPFVLGEFYNYGGYGELRGIQGIAPSGISGNPSQAVRVNGHHVYHTVSGFSYSPNSILVELNRIDVSNQFGAGDAGEPWQNNDNPNEAGVQIEYVRNNKPNGPVYGNSSGLSESRYFEWTFTDGVDDYICKEYVNDTNYFRGYISPSKGLNIDEGTNTLNLYVQTNYAGGTPVVGFHKARATLEDFSNPSSPSVIKTWESVVYNNPPNNGEYYDGEVEANTIHISSDFTKPTLLTHTITANKWYRITIETKISSSFDLPTFSGGNLSKTQINSGVISYIYY